MSASFDGIMLPMKTKPQKAKDEKKTYYKEAACAAVCFYDQTGQRLSTLRFGRMPEAKKATLKINYLKRLKIYFTKNQALHG
jgi:hypothetical protein